MLAAGRGSRFGGAKQWQLLPGLNRTLLEFNLDAAVEYGFRDLVVVVADGEEVAARDRLEGRLPDEVSLQTPVQRPVDLPRQTNAPIGSRDRPWGTGHALWAAREAIDRPFAVINADDYYGPDTFEKLGKHLRESPGWALAAFRLEDTLSPHGGVNRALCRVDDAGYLTGLQEWTSILNDRGTLRGIGADGETARVDPTARVSMNAWALRPECLPLLEHGLRSFIADRPGETQEYYLPDAIEGSVTRGDASVRVLEVEGNWLGITYQEDVERVARELSRDAR